MLTIRLQRVGRKNDPSFRVVVTDSKNGPQSGKFLEILGSYNARFGKPQLNSERINHWISKGAQISDTVRNMLVKFKVIKSETVNVLGPKPVKPEAPKEEVKEKVKTEEVKEEVKIETPAESITEAETSNITSEEVPVAEAPEEIKTEEGVA